MARLTELDDVLFPVEEHPVFAIVMDGASERRLPVRDKKAIVNAKSGAVLGIVSRGYRLVSNREALEMALQCCRAVFPETKASEWEVKATDAPGTGGHCNIDLAHNSTALDFSFVPAANRPEAFGPFIRVTNSYNGLRALGFDIGFYRKICTNGVIIPSAIIRFKFVHSRRDIGETILFSIADDRLARLKASFGDFLGALRKCSVPRSNFGELVCGVLGLRAPKQLKSHAPDPEEWVNLVVHIERMTGAYSGDLGENAYAAFNVITDFASHPPANRCVHRDRHSLQRLAGSWVSRFSQQCCQPSFDLKSYLEDLAKPQTESAP